MDNFNHILTQPFYNTIQLTDQQWQDENKKAFALMKIIEKVYESNPSTLISGWQMKNFLSAKMNKNINILSVRRSISNLKKADVLIKTFAMRVGDEGKSEHYHIWAVGNEKYKTEKVTGKTLAEFANNLINESTK